MLFFVLFALVNVTVEDDSDYDVLTETEYELKRMLRFVTPLMAILRKDERVKRSFLDKFKPASRSDSYGYGGGGHESSYYPSTCCDEKTDYLGLLSFISLGLLGLFLVALLSTTSTSSGRRKRSDDEAGNDVSEDDPSMFLLLLSCYFTKNKTLFLLFFSGSFIRCEREKSSPNPTLGQ